MPWLEQQMTTANADSCCEIGDVKFYGDGTFRVENRIFPRKAAVDLRWKHNHAEREAGSSMLTVRSQGDRYVFEFVSLRNTWFRHTPIAESQEGTADLSQLPRKHSDFGDLVLITLGVALVACWLLTLLTSR